MRDPIDQTDSVYLQDHVDPPRHPSIYDEISRRLNGFSRELIKREVYLSAYSAPPADPWVRHLVLQEFWELVNSGWYER